MQLENERELRRQIDKADEDNYYDKNQAKSELALYYLVERKGYSFTFNNLKDYLEDYLLRDITVAEEYLITAAEVDQTRFRAAVASLATTIAPRYVQGLGELGDKIVAKANTKKQTAIRYEEIRYVGCEDIGVRPEVFDKKHINKYLVDYLSGEESAKNLVLQGAQDYPEDYARVLSSIANSEDCKKIMGLLVAQPERTKALRSLIVKTAKGLMCFSCSPFEMAQAIETILPTGVLGDVLEDTTLKDYRSLILENNAISYISSVNNFVAVVKLFGLQHFNKVAAGLFKSLFIFSAKDSTENAFNVIFNHLLELNKIAISLTADVPSILSGQRHQAKDITLDYYLASMKAKITDLVYLATQSNPEMFKELFLAEIDLIKRHDLNGKIFRDKKVVYTHLLPLLKAYRYYDILVASVNQLAVVNQEPNIAEQSSTLLTYIPSLAFVPTPNFSNLLKLSFLSSSKQNDSQGEEMRSGPPQQNGRQG